MKKHMHCNFCILLLMFMTPFLVISQQITPESFKMPSTYHDAMFFYITSVHIDNGFNETHLVPGDKIGIFDASAFGDTICVGMRECDDLFAQGYFPPEWLTLVATRDQDNNENDIPETGFVAGHTAIFAVYKSREDEVYVLDSNEILTDSPTGEKVGSPVFEPKADATVRIYGGSNTPVEMTFFRISSLPQDRGALLSWQTASETNNFGFNIQRTRQEDKENWKTIGFVNGQGTSNKIHSYQFIDDEKLLSGTYFYRLKQMDTDGSYRYTAVETRIVQAPALFALEQNVPNPFNPRTTISFQLKNDSYVNISVYNIHGRKIATLVDGDKKSGHHTIRYDPKDMSAGTYFYTMQAGSFKETRKMTLLK